MMFVFGIIVGRGCQRILWRFCFNVIHIIFVNHKVNNYVNFCQTNILRLFLTRIEGRSASWGTEMFSRRCETDQGSNFFCHFFVILGFLRKFLVLFTPVFRDDYWLISWYNSVRYLRIETSTHIRNTRIKERLDFLFLLECHKTFCFQQGKTIIEHVMNDSITRNVSFICVTLSESELSSCTYYINRDNYTSSLSSYQIEFTIWRNKLKVSI